MSLLTQFYPGPGGGGTFPAGVPNMGMGGIVGGAPTSVFLTGVGSISGNGFFQVGSGTVSGAGTSVTIPIDPTSKAPLNILDSGNMLYGGTSTANGKTEGQYIVFQNTCINDFYNTPSFDFGNMAGAYGMIFGASTFVDLNDSTLQFTGTKLEFWKQVHFGSWYPINSPVAITFNCPLLSDLTESTWMGFLGLSYPVTLNFSGTVLNQASVDHILTSYAATTTSNYSSTVTFNLGGGCAAPSAAGLSAKTYLSTKNAVVITN